MEEVKLIRNAECRHEPSFVVFPHHAKTREISGGVKGRPAKSRTVGKVGKKLSEHGMHIQQVSTATHVREVDAVVVSGDLVGDSCAVAVSGGDGDGGEKKQHFKVFLYFLDLN